MTVAATPSSRFSRRSIRAAQAPQVIPVTTSSACDLPAGGDVRLGHGLPPMFIPPMSVAAGRVPPLPCTATWEWPVVTGPSRGPGDVRPGEDHGEQDEEAGQLDRGATGSPPGRFGPWQARLTSQPDSRG